MTLVEEQDLNGQLSMTIFFSMLKIQRIIFLKELYTPKKEGDVQILRKELRKYFSRSIKSKEYISWLAEYKGELIAFGGMVVRQVAGHFSSLSGKQAYILNMYTKPEARGKGICNVILNKLIADAESLDLEILSLHASKYGMGIYKKRGFIPPAHEYLELKIK